MNKIIPTPRDKHPDPKLRGDRISGERYYSKEFMQKEWDHMWTKVWQIAGIASEIPEPDDFFVYKIGLEEVLVVRQKDNSVNTETQSNRSSSSTTTQDPRMRRVR